MVPKGKKLLEINALYKFPSSATGSMPISRVSPFMYFSSYYIVNGGALVGELFNCNNQKDLSYFCYENKKMSLFDKYRDAGRYGDNQLTGPGFIKDLKRISEYFDYLLIIDNDKDNKVQYEDLSDQFDFIYSLENVYLLRSKYH
jgi:hypothetical protein